MNLLTNCDPRSLIILLDNPNFINTYYYNISAKSWLFVLFVHSINIPIFENLLITTSITVFYKLSSNPMIKSIIIHLHSQFGIASGYNGG